MSSDLNLSILILKLESWTVESSSFHLDRQLSDEVLIADGWNCEPDPSFEGGFRWWTGKNPQYSTGDNRPHVINDISAAMGIVPFRAMFRIEGCFSQSTYKAKIWDLSQPLSSFTGESSRLTVAVLIAALKYKQHMQALLKGDPPSELR